MYLVEQGGITDTISSVFENTELDFILPKVHLRRTQAGLGRTV